MPWSSPFSPGGGGGGGGGLAEERVAHFYYQVLADSFGKELPGVRRAEEQLAALAGEWLIKCIAVLLIFREHVCVLNTNVVAAVLEEKYR